MEEIEFILKWTEDLKAEISTLQFEKDDIRNDFFGLIYSTAYQYYKGYISYNLSLFIRQGKIAFNDNISSFKVHIDRLAQVSQKPTLAQSHTNSLNRNLQIDSWSVFELCVTPFCYALCENHELEKLLNYSYTEVINCLKKSDLDESDSEKLKRHLIKENLVHVPITRKTDFLFNKAVNYYGDIKKDKEFLIFLGKLRNTMHTNFIYYGKDYEYKFGHAHFVFKNGKLVKWLDPFEPSPKLYFYLVGRLKEIWKNLITSIKHDEIIFYPDLDQE